MNLPQTNLYRQQCSPYMIAIHPTRNVTLNGLEEITDPTQNPLPPASPAPANNRTAFPDLPSQPQIWVPRPTPILG
jgi:hypothetical protein